MNANEQIIKKALENIDSVKGIVYDQGDNVIGELKDKDGGKLQHYTQGLNLKFRNAIIEFTKTAKVDYCYMIIEFGEFKHRVELGCGRGDVIFNDEIVEPGKEYTYSPAT